VADLLLVDLVIKLYCKFIKIKNCCWYHL